MSPEQSDLWQEILALDEELGRCIMDEQFDGFEQLGELQSRRQQLIVELFHPDLTDAEMQCLRPCAEQLLLADSQHTSALRRRQAALSREHQGLTRKSAAISAYRTH